MGRKLWLVLALVAGIALTASGRPRESLASFAPGPVQTLPTVHEQPQQQSGLPLVLDSGLVAEELVDYEGPYVEDGTNEPVSGVAALMLYNSGGRDISAAMVAVTQGGRVLHFYVTWLPAGERVLVLEFDRAAYSREGVTAGRSDGVRWEVFHPACGTIRVSETDGAVTLENRGICTVEGIRLRYKSYIREGDFYLGGITYSAYIGALPGGKSREVSPFHYAQDAARVVAVLTQ